MRSFFSNRSPKSKPLASVLIFTTLARPTATPKGIYVIEALAAGIPVVQPDHGHFPELLARTGGGILFPAGDRDALVENLVGLLEDTTRRRTLGNEGRKNVATMASANRMAEETLAVYRSLRTARAKT